MELCHIEGEKKRGKGGGRGICKILKKKKSTCVNDVSHNDIRNMTKDEIILEQKEKKGEKRERKKEEKKGKRVKSKRKKKRKRGRVCNINIFLNKEKKKHTCACMI